MTGLQEVKKNHLPEESTNISQHSITLFIEQRKIRYIFFHEFFARFAVRIKSFPCCPDEHQRACASVLAAPNSSPMIKDVKQ